MSEFYHLGFSGGDLGPDPPSVAFLSGDPHRAEAIARDHLHDPRTLSTRRGLHSYLGTTADGRPILSATSGMGAPSLSIVVNELVQAGVRTIIRIGTSGGLQPRVKVGDVVITSGALCRQGAALDIAPPEYPAVADPFLTVRLAEAARGLGADFHVGVTASVDTFYEGQGRTGGANPHLLRSLRGVVEEYQQLGVLNFEMEAGTLLKMGGVYGFRAACICAIIAQRTEAEEPSLEHKDAAVERAIRVALRALELDASAGA